MASREVPPIRTGRLLNVLDSTGIFVSSVWLPRVFDHIHRRMCVNCVLLCHYPLIILTCVSFGPVTQWSIWAPWVHYAPATLYCLRCIWAQLFLFFILFIFLNLFSKIIYGYGLRNSFFFGEMNPFYGRKTRIWDLPHTPRFGILTASL